MYKIEFTDKAEEDLYSSLRYIADVLKAPTAAKKLLEEIEHKVKILESSPLCCAIVSDEYLRIKEIRSLLVKNYLVFYIVKEEENIVSIIRVLYGRRDWMRLLKND
jgi:toxin ParE1/3/4